MRDNPRKIDSTVVQNYLAKYKYLVEEYERVKEKVHPHYTKVMDFYAAHNLDRRNFLKYYHRYQQGRKDYDLLPQKRGPKYKTRRPCAYIEQKVVTLREKGNNRYEIYNLLKPTLKKHTPSPSGIYNVLKRHNLNRMTKKMQENKRKIVKERIGQMGHADMHHITKGILEGTQQRLYLFCIIDDYSRVAWAEVVERISSVEVMFAALKSLNILHDEYGIRFEEVLTDNGGEFGGRGSKQKERHPFERLLLELGIKHRYTRPYRPQTNGKVERFWRTIDDDLLAGTTYKDLAELKEEVLQYMYYYNHERSHMGIQGKKPIDLLPK